MAERMRWDIAPPNFPRAQRKSGETSVRESGEEIADGPRLDRAIQMVMPALLARYPKSMEPQDLYRVLRGHSGEAIRAVEALQYRALEAGENWDDAKLSEIFCKALTQVGKMLLTGKHGDLGERLLNTKGGTTGYDEGAMIGGGESEYIGASSDGSTTTISTGCKRSKCGTTILMLSSADREGWNGAPPNVCRYDLGKTTGVDYHLSMSGLTRVVLRGVNANCAPLFTERPDGATFYIGIDEITNEYNRESSLNMLKGQFECFAKPNILRNNVSVSIVTGTIDLPETSIDLGRLTIRFYDEIKRPLALEQDIYSILGYAWDDVLHRLILNIGPHDIRNADRIAVRNYEISQDRSLLYDSHDFRAEVISPTQIAIYVWRPPLPIWVPPPPEGDRVPRGDGPYLIDLNNVVKVSLAIDYLRD